MTCRVGVIAAGVGMEVDVGLLVGLGVADRVAVGPEVGDGIPVEAGVIDLGVGVGVAVDFGVTVGAGEMGVGRGAIDRGVGV